MSLATLLWAVWSSAAAAQGLEIGERDEVKPLLPGQPSGLGVGLVLGQPTGFALAQRLGTVGVLQGGVGYDFADESLHLSGDYIQNFAILNSESTPKMRYVFSVGLGGRILAGSGDGLDGLGVRVPVGLTFLPRETALDVYVEISPVVLVYPSIDATLEGAVGFRIYPGGLGKGTTSRD
jgi:hypothetical protein